MEEKTHFIANYLTQTWQELAEYLLQHPDKLTMSQVSYWQSYYNLWQEFYDKNHLSKTHDALHDKRFQHADWQKNLIYNFIQRSYQLLIEHTDKLTKELEIKNGKKAQKFRFYSRQLIDAVSPSNFINTNPEIFSKTLETNGANLLEGFKQFKQDLERNQGQLQIKLSDTSQFELGKNIACTPGKVVFQNDLIQLIQYTPTTKKVYEIPLLIIPPWINKYYILDLQQDNSFVKWLLDQGYVVFMISWVNPTHEHKDKEFSHYLLEGPLAALSIINEITKHNIINILGYCIGGTLLGCLLAYLAKKKNNINILSATFLTTLFDFSEPGELGTFIDEQQLTMLEEYMNKKGYLDGNMMASIFNALRANDLIWSAFVNNYLKGQQPKPFDLLYWNADSTNIPALTHRFYLRNMYLNNLLIQPDKIKLNNVPIDLGKINVPSYFLATQDDHIVPWKSCYQSHRFLKNPVKFVLAGSGHVAGVINPPQKKKYGYWTNPSTPTCADDFLASATFHKGSWWTDWRDWLSQYSGKLIAAHAMQLNREKFIEDAPGSYVKVKIADIAKIENEIQK